MGLTSSKATVRIETPPGDQAQFDWSEYSMVIGGRERKVYCFAMILAASRKKAVCFSLKVDAAAIYEAIQELSKYLLKEYGIDRDGVMTPKPPTYEELRKKANRLYRTCFLYWEFLVANDLRDEAYEYVRERIDGELPFDSFDWDIAQ